MNNLKILGGIVLCVISLQLTAQVKAPLNEPLAEKPFLFAALPDKFTISTIAIDKIFAGSSSGTVKIAIEHDKFLEGTIIEKLQVNEKVTAVNITLPGYDRALFTITRFTAENGPPNYTGRIINIKYADVLLLKKEAGVLYLLKEKQSLFLVE